MPLVNQNVNTIPAFKRVKGPPACTDPYAFYFNGANNSVSADATDPIFNITNFISISAWFKIDPGINPPVAGTLYMMVDKASAPPGGTAGYSLYVRQNASNNKIAFSVNLGNGNPLSQRRVDFNITDFDTHHVVGTYDGVDTLRLFVDGVEEDSQTIPVGGAIPVQPSPFCIGNTNTGTLPNEFYGTLDEISVWNTTLNLAQVQEIYDFNTNCDLNALGYSANLVAWYRMGENAQWNLPTAPNEWTLTNISTSTTPNGELESQGMLETDRVPGII